MPVPMWVARVNRRVFNPMEIKRGTRPLLTHVGRSSGNTHKTPLDAHQVDGGYIFIVMYGPESDWVKNVLTSGTATLEVGGEEIALGSPRMISKADAWDSMPATAKAPPDFLKVTDYLRMDVQG